MQQKVLFLTGAGSGIGAAAARLFASRGWYVCLSDVNREAVEKLLAEIGADNGMAVGMDVTDQRSVDTALETLAARTGRHLDVLFNCAGVLSVGAFSALNMDAHLRHLEINATGVVRMARSAYPLLCRTPGSRMISMSSASATYGTPDFASYSASKFAVRGLTEALNLEWRREGIHVCDIMPPFVATPMLAHEPQVQSMKTLGINLKAEDVARVVWHAATGPKRVHWPVSAAFKAIYHGSRFLPDWVQRAVMRKVSGY